MKRIYVIPRWGNTSHDEWYPWLKEELQNTSKFESVEVLDMPQPNVPIIKNWTEYLRQKIGNSTHELSKTYLVGHSIGVQAILRYLATLPSSIKIPGILGVAAWWKIDQPWDSVKPWLETPLDLSRVKSMVNQTLILISDNDPITHDWKKNKTDWEKKLDAKVQVIHGAEHFREQVEFPVLEAIEKYF